jgi:hypothetical protein
MLAAWLPRFLVPIAIALAFVLFRRMAPPRVRMAGHRYDESQIHEPLAAGVIGGAMWSLGIALAMLFFVLRGANHLWASLEGTSLLTQYAPQVFWCFLPGFAAVSIPWPLTVWYLRRVGRWEEADSVQNASDSFQQPKAKGLGRTVHCVNPIDRPASTPGLCRENPVYPLIMYPAHLKITAS